MKKNKICLFFLIIAMLFTTNSRVFACDEEQTNTYVTQILFGSSSLSKRSDDKVTKLLDALYLCSEQTDNDGEQKLNNLKEIIRFGLPSFEDLKIKKENLLECSHTRWSKERKSSISNQWKVRYKLLQNTVNGVLDFGFFNRTFRIISDECNAFAKLLYYLHIFADYIADNPENTTVNINGKSIPAYSGSPYYIINNDTPFFSATDKKQFNETAQYSQLDYLGRAGAAYVKISPDSLSKIGPREDMRNLRPPGFSTKRYEGYINTDQSYLYNRCHLIAHELTGKESIDNLITGTYYLNNTGMKDLEDIVADYIKYTGSSVLYRATPIYKGENAVASGVQLEVYSIDHPEWHFNRFYYNVQPGVEINYFNGDSELSDMLFGKEGIIPFASSDASDTNPDLLHELRNVLKEVFKDQVNTDTYKIFDKKIESIEKKARDLSATKVVKPGEMGRLYLKYKELQYEYLETLKTYVPLFLQKEKFFKPLLD